MGGKERTARKRGILWRIKNPQAAGGIGEKGAFSAG